MAISEKKMQMVIANYFEDECDVNTSIRQAFEKGFRIGVKKGASTGRPSGKWITRSGLGITEIKCSVCGDKAFAPLRINKTCELITRNFCPNCGAEMSEESE